MAQKNTRAQQAAANTNSKKPAASSKSGANKSSGKSKKQSAVHTEYERRISGSDIFSWITGLLFILFLGICINPDGKLLVIIKDLMDGLIGRAGFYFSVPAMLYLCYLHAFRRKNAAVMRSVCTAVFVICCGCIYHLTVHAEAAVTGAEWLPELYLSGIQGRSGGVLCGGLAFLLRWSCGTAVSYILISIAAVLTLLGAMNLTIPSLTHAIINRPRDDWEREEQQEVRLEPAAVMVNHIANKKIEKKRQLRQKQEENPSSKPEETPAAAKKQRTVTAPEPLIISGPIEPAPGEIELERIPSHSKAADVMSAIDCDIDAPIFAEKQKKNSSAKTRLSSAPEVETYAPLLEPEEFIPAPDLPAKSAPPQIKAVKQNTKATAPEVKPGKVTEKEAQESAQQVAKEIEQGSAILSAAYSFPPVQLLKRPAGAAADGTEEMRENSRRLNETLESFHIDAHIINVTRGPSVTRYEVELDKGVRLSKLTNCADDIALSLGASGVRIAAVPGKISIVGIEVPNRAVTTVSLREVIDSPEFGKAKSRSSFAVGKDIGGSCIVGNIAKMPHMLIAGTTGSGKSVCMNSIIISLLYKSGPEDVKLIMVDPKMVELGIYNGIPHLLIPVVTDPKKAAGSLQWAVTEMLRRYKQMSDVGVRDLESYNSIIMAEEGGQKLPQVVIIIDELADLMLVAAKEVEDSICRIAQMGRAAGMHLIIATQRPSADVITGLMKANIPSRIAFSVASSMESRIILDTQGAEKLVGKGDMLYAPIGIGKPLRVQGCFVTDQEVEAVTGYVKDNFVADYNQEVLDDIEKRAQQTGSTKGAKTSAAEPSPSSEELEGDELLPAAVEVILETKQASASMLQRRLKLGYARAARIIDEMEEKGIVGPFQGSKPRAILITKESWAAMQGGPSPEDVVPEE